MKKNLLVFTAICLFIFTAAGPAAGSATGDGSVTIVPPSRGMYSIGDKLIFSGTNTASGTTYLFITGPGLDADGAQVQSTHPLSSPVINGDASTFQAAITSTGNRWLWTWDTQNVPVDGTYTIYAVSKPRDLPHINETHYASDALIIMKPANNRTTTGTGSPGGNPADAGMSPVDSSVTITRPAGGMHLHTIGNTLTFSGTNLSLIHI